MKFIKTLIGLPLILIILVFAIVNNDMATFSLWPTGIEITVSLSVAIVFLLILGYIIGWFFTWLSYSEIRKALRQQRRHNKKLSKDQEKLSKEVEGLQGDIEILRSADKTKEKTTLKEKIRNIFYHKSVSDLEKK